MATDQTVKLHCDMKAECEQDVTYIDDHGFVYCTNHGQQRQSWRRCRKLRAHELNRLRRGQQVKSY
jgi:hypothetical protein